MRLCFFLHANFIIPAGNVLIDSLLNYETVKYFQNDEVELAKYDRLLVEYSRSSMRVCVMLNGEGVVKMCGENGIEW
jgi:ATP-binding cassette, subfamily B, heavy metal transporter